MLERMISQTKILTINFFFPFNFAIIKICVAIHLAEDEEWATYSFDYPLVIKLVISIGDLLLIKNIT